MSGHGRPGSAGWRGAPDVAAVEVLDRVRGCLLDNRLCVLGTVGLEDGLAQLTPCFFAPVREASIAFVSSRTSGHVRNLDAEARVRVLVTDPCADPGGRMRSVQIHGVARRAGALERARVLPVYVGRYARGAAGMIASGADELRQKELYVVEPVRVTLLDTAFRRGAVSLERDEELAARA